MKTIARAAFAETEEKKSRFLAELVFYEDLASRIGELRAQHPKANHHVTAYRYLNDAEQLIEHGKDDGDCYTLFRWHEAWHRRACARL